MKIYLIVLRLEFVGCNLLFFNYLDGCNVSRSRENIYICRFYFERKEGWFFVGLEFCWVFFL